MGLPILIKIEHFLITKKALLFSLNICANRPPIIFLDNFSESVSKTDYILKNLGVTHITNKYSKNA